MTTLTTAWVLGCVYGFFIGVTVAGRRRQSTCRENTNPPSGPPPLKLRRSESDLPEQFIRMDEGRVQRGNGYGAPATPKPNIIPKPQFPPPRKIREDFLP